MKIHPAAAMLIILGVCAISLGLIGVPLNLVTRPEGLMLSFFLFLAVVLLVALVLAIISPFTRPKKASAPRHPMTKAGNLFALLSVGMVVLSFALDAGLGLVSAGSFFFLAIVCWIFGFAFAKA